MGSPWDTHTQILAEFTAGQHTSVHGWGVAGKVGVGVGVFFTGSCCCCCCKMLGMSVRVCETAVAVGKHSTRRGHDVVAELPHGNSRHSDRFQLTRSSNSSACRVIRESRLFPQFYWLLVNFFGVFQNPPPSHSHPTFVWPLSASCDWANCFA